MTEPELTPTVADVRRWLGEIPDMCALLPDALVTRSARSEARRPIPQSRPPVNVGILDLADQRRKHDWLSGSMAWCDPDRMGVLPFLDSWVRDLEAAAHDGDPVFGIRPRPDLPPAAPDEPTVAAVCGWLARELDWAATLPQWFELADGIRHTHSRLRAATRSVRDEEQRPVPCGRCGDPLQAVEGERLMWECASGHLTTVQAVTVRQAAKIMGYNRNDLYAIVNRPALLDAMGVARLTPVLAEASTKKLYDLNDLRRVVAEVKMRGAG